MPALFPNGGQAKANPRDFKFYTLGSTSTEAVAGAGGASDGSAKAHFGGSMYRGIAQSRVFMHPSSINFVSVGYASSPKGHLLSLD